MLNNLKRLRKEYGISQQQLADAVHVSQPSINKYENHDIEPEIEILKRMADYFNTTIDYLVGYTDQRNKPSLPPATPFLSAEETAWLGHLQGLSKEQRACVLQTIRLFLRMPAKQ